MLPFSPGFLMRSGRRPDKTLATPLIFSFFSPPGVLQVLSATAILFDTSFSSCLLSFLQRQTDEGPIQASPLDLNLSLKFSSCLFSQRDPQLFFPQPGPGSLTGRLCREYFRLRQFSHVFVFHRGIAGASLCFRVQSHLAYAAHSRVSSLSGVHFVVRGQL